MQIFIYLKQNKMKYNLYQFTQTLFENEKRPKGERKGEENVSTNVFVQIAVLPAFWKKNRQGA